MSFLRLAATEIVGADAADADGAAEGFDGNTRSGMEGRHRVAHVLKAHESLGIHGALHAVNDLIGSDNAQRGQVRTFLFQEIDGPCAGGGVDAHVGVVSASCGPGC